MSGYDKSPDYGGKDPPPWFWLAVGAGLAAFIWFALRYGGG
jgi:hypothetical protein